MYNNASKTSITCSMPELHQRNLCLCLLLFGGWGESRSQSHVVLFISWRSLLVVVETGVPGENQRPETMVIDKVYVQM
jgi:hypothetical protein